MTRRLLLAALLVLTMALGGCGGNDNRVCVREHEEQYSSTVYVQSGNVLIPITSSHTRTVCDEYATVTPEGS